MSNASYELPNTELVVIDGYKIDLSAGALGGQALVYDAGSNTFIAADAYGTVSGSFITKQVAYSNGTFSLTGNNNFLFDDGYNVLSVYGDGYYSQRLIINGSTAAVSASGTGALRFNSGTSHLEFSENGGGWTQIGAGTIAIGASIASGTNKSILFIDSSIHLAQDNSNFNYDSSTKKLTVAGHIAVDGYTIDLSAGATTNQVLTYNGTSFVAQTGGGGGLSGTLTSTKVPYATGSSTLADSGMAWDNTNKILTITTLAGNDGVAVTDGTRSLGLFVNYNAAAVGALGTTSAHNLVFFTNSQAAQMTLNTSGQLGIGISPAYKLDVNGDIHISANRLLIDASSAAVSPSGMGALRFNTGTSHLEFSENGGGWTQFGAGGIATNDWFFSLIDYTNSGTDLGQNPQSLGGQQTSGIEFYVTQAATCTGIRFYWKNASAGNVKVNLWNVATTISITNTTIAVSGVGVYTATFSGSQSLTAYKRYIVSAVDMSNTTYTTISVNTTIVPGGGGASNPMQFAPQLYVMNSKCWVAGDAYPSSTASTEVYPVEPIYTVP